MTIEEAIMILDPETRRESLREIPVLERIDTDQEACRIAVAALRAQQEDDTSVCAAGTTIKANVQGDPDETYILGIYSTAYQARKVLLDMATHICDGGGQVYQMPPDQVPAPTPEKWISQLSAGLVERAYE